jgi:hypothetical protein
MEQTNGGRIIDPFEAEQERMKWMNKAQYALVLFIRGIVFFCNVFLKIMLEVLKNILRTFKILPK